MQDALHLAALATQQIGSPAFAPSIGRLCQSLSAYDGFMIYAFCQDEVPRLLFSNLAPSDIQACWPPYFGGAYLLDPFYALFRAQAPDGLYRLKDLAPDDFYDSEYHKSFYLKTGLRDEITLVFGLAEGTQIHVSLGLRSAQVQVTDQDLQRLQAFAPLLTALCSRHWSDLTATPASPTPHTGAHLDRAFQRFGASVLSEREAETARLILMGHSGKSIARELNISPETVKVYRKRVHSKLHIRSQAELFSLFLTSVQNAPIGVDQDPLAFVAFKATP